MAADIWARGTTLEECYEFMLAYAAQGIRGETREGAGSEIRSHLERAVQALDGLAGSCRTVVLEERLEPSGKYQAFIDVLERDAGDARAALELALAQPSISSQLIDNLNASIHVRALLTDLFFLGDILSNVAKSAPGKRD